MYFPYRRCHLSWCCLQSEETEEEAWETCKKDWAKGAERCNHAIHDPSCRILALVVSGVLLFVIYAAWANRNCTSISQDSCQETAAAANLGVK